MAQITRINDRDAIRRFAGREPGKFLFELADLDDSAWSRTQYYGIESGGDIKELCLLFDGLDPPNMVATVSSDERAMEELLSGVATLLPDRFTAALPRGMAKALSGRYEVRNAGRFFRMAVSNGDAFEIVDVEGIDSLFANDEPEIAGVVRECFERPFLDSLQSHPRPFFGIRRDGMFASIAGTTFLAPQVGIGAVGPVATRPAFQGNGFATRTTARLCVELASLGAAVIGLHVRASNSPAIRTYEKLGFEPAYEFDSCSFSV